MTSRTIDIRCDRCRTYLFSLDPDDREGIAQDYYCEECKVEPSGHIDMQIIFNKIYDGESIVDLSRDVDECLNECYNTFMHNIPHDEHGLYYGSFRVTIEWQDDENE